MPAALPIDHDQVRIVAVQIGVREAARQFGLSEEVVRKWSQREGWMSRQEEQEGKIEQIRQDLRVQRGLSPVVPTAAEILKKWDGETRLKLACGIHKGADAVSQMDGQEVLMAAPLVSQLAKSAAVVHGWTGNSASVSIRLDVLASDSSSPVIDV